MPTASRLSTLAVVTVTYGLCVIAASAVPSLRYLKYGLVPLAMMFAAVAAPRTSPRHHALRALIGQMGWLLGLALAASCLVTLAHQTMSARFLEESFFLTAPLIVAMAIVVDVAPDVIDDYVSLMFYAVVAAFVVERHGALLEVIVHPSAIVSQFLNSLLETESSTSFVFGLYGLYFWFTRRRARSLVAFACLCLSFKRIAIVAAFVMLLVYVIDRRWRIDLHRRRWMPVLLVAVNATFFVGTYLLSQGTFDDVIEDVTGLSSNFVTMGRVSLYDYLIDESGFRVLGSGLGHTTNLLAMTDFGVMNAHSDILKYTLELGPVVSAALILEFYRRITRTREFLFLAGYLNVLFISDNVSIYFDTTFVFVLMLLALKAPLTLERTRCGDATRSA